LATSSNNLRNYALFCRIEETKKGKTSKKMVGNVSFRLDPAEREVHVTQDDVAPPENEMRVDLAGAPELAPPRLPYAPGPGSYTQLWTSQSARMTAEEMKNDMDSYLVPYTDATLDYNAIQVTVLNLVDWIGFLTILLDDQVVLVHSLGFSSGLGRQTAAHNRIFGLLGEKVGNKLPPMVMAPMTGLVPWLRVQEQLEPDDADLVHLESRIDKTIPIPIPAAPLTEDNDGQRSVQNICFVPKAWAAYFLALMTPWHALQVYKRLLHTIPPALRSGFDFLGSWLAVACTHGPGATPESLLWARWQNPHFDCRMISWMQRHTRFVNAMPEAGLAGGMAPTLDPQECFNKALETVAALSPPSGSGAIRDGGPPPAVP
jgi:hypothetical protein